MSRHQKQMDKVMKEGDREQDEESEDNQNEDTAYTQRHRSRHSQSRSRAHIGHGEVTEGVNFDEISESELDSEDPRDREILHRLRQSRSLRRVGTSHPDRNLDGTIDRRRSNKG